MKKLALVVVLVALLVVVNQYQIYQLRRQEQARSEQISVLAQSIQTIASQSFLQMLGMEDLRRRFSEPPLVVRL